MVEEKPGKGGTWAPVSLGEFRKNAVKHAAKHILSQSFTVSTWGLDDEGLDPSSKFVDLLFPLGFVFFLIQGQATKPVLALNSPMASYFSLPECCSYRQELSCQFHLPPEMQKRLNGLSQRHQDQKILFQSIRDYEHSGSQR